MEKKFVDLITNHLHYDISKLYEGVWNNYPIVGMNFKSIVSCQNDIKEGLNKKFGSMKDLPGLEVEIKKVDYILERISNWLETHNLYGNKDAEIFIDGLSDRFDEIEGMLKELDDRYK